MTMRLAFIFLSAILTGCAALPGGQVTDAALMVHTAGSRHDTVAVTIPADAADVFAAFVLVVEEQPNVEVVERKDSAMLLEVTRDGASVTGQATRLDDQRSILYIWADAGETGSTGRDLATGAAAAICDKLGVPYEVVNY